MLDANTMTLYVADFPASREFYKVLLGCEPIDFSPGFAIFFQESGARVAIWARDGVEPAPTPPGGCELCFYVQDDRDVDAIHEQWTALGVTIVKSPWRSPFIYSFLAADPDGHRLRVYRPMGSGSGN